MQQETTKWKYFNSQPHEEADEDTGNIISQNNISTHSLTKRLTRPQPKQMQHWKISTHSLTKRLTWGDFYLIGIESYFNSQPHEEADNCGKERLNHLTYFNSQPHEEADFLLHFSHFATSAISTHSLTKRLTKYRLKMWQEDKIFQLTASRRGWLCASLYLLYLLIFQLTASRRGWLAGIGWQYSSKAFQLTASRRGWQETPIQFIITKTFQLTASRRGWQWSSFSCSESGLFQLTASRRGWQGETWKEWQRKIFQLTASRRGWHCSHPYLFSDSLISTHSLTKRLTTFFILFSSLSLYFNSQPHEEADRRLNAGRISSVISTHSLTKRLTAISHKNF